MKTLMLIAMIALPTTAFAVENPGKFEAYKQRRAERKSQALDARRQYNASKGPHVYRTAIAVKAPMRPYIVSEQGFVRQPPIPMRPVVGVAHYAPYHYTAFPRRGVSISQALARR